MAPVIIITPTKGFFRLGLDVLWYYRELLYFLVWRDFKVRYKQTLVGVAWALVTPLFSVFVLTMVFGVLARIPSEGLPYGAFAFAGFLPWNYFSGAVTRATNSLVANSRLVT